MAAAEQGVSALVLERAPEYLRGGNSFFTGGLFRFAYDGIDQIVDIIPEIGRRGTAQHRRGALHPSAVLRPT